MLSADNQWKAPVWPAGIRKGQFFKLEDAAGNWGKKSVYTDIRSKKYAAGSIFSAPFSLTLCAEGLRGSFERRPPEASVEHHGEKLTLTLLH